VIAAEGGGLPPVPAAGKYEGVYGNAAETRAPKQKSRQALQEAEFLLWTTHRWQHHFPSIIHTHKEDAPGVAPCTPCRMCSRRSRAKDL
jgi:hypothetical protein